MNVEEAVLSAVNMSDNSVLVAIPPFSWGSEAMFAEYTNDYRLPTEIQSAGYECILGKEDLLNLISDATNKKMSSKSLAELVIHYAVFDAYPAWIDDIPVNSGVTH
jgi:hypothetical protein